MAEPCAVEVLRYHRLHVPVPFGGSGRRHGDFAHVDGKPRFRDGVHAAENPVGRLDFFARGDVGRFFRVEEVHLHSRDVDARAALLEVFYLGRVVLVGLVVVYVEQGVFGQALLGDVEGVEGVVSLHYAVPAARDFGAWNHHPVGEVGCGLVYHVEAVDFAGVPLGDFGDALFVEIRDFLPDAPEEPVGFLLRYFLEVLFVKAVSAVFGEVVVGFLFPFRHEREDPFGIVPRLVAPHERVPVHANLLLVKEFHHGVGRGPAPVGLGFRVFAVVPPLLGVPVFLRKARAVGLHFKLLPVERDRGGIEERAVEIPVLFVALGGSELVEVEDVRAEYEVVLYLLDLHVPSCGGLAEVYHGVGLAVFFDVFVDFLLDVRVPNGPVLPAHYLVGVFGLRFRESRGGERRCGRRNRGGDG